MMPAGEVQDNHHVLIRLVPHGQIPTGTLLLCWTSPNSRSWVIPWAAYIATKISRLHMTLRSYVSKGCAAENLKGIASAQVHLSRYTSANPNQKMLKKKALSAFITSNPVHPSKPLCARHAFYSGNTCMLAVPADGSEDCQQALQTSLTHNAVTARWKAGAMQRALAGALITTNVFIALNNHPTGRITLTQSLACRRSRGKTYIKPCAADLNIPTHRS